VFVNQNVWGSRTSRGYEPLFPSSTSGSHENTNTFIGAKRRDCCFATSRRKASMMFRTPKGCETIKNKQKQKKVLKNFFSLSFFECVCESERLGSRTSRGYEPLFPSSISGSNENTNTFKNKQKQKKVLKNFFLCLFLIVSHPFGVRNIIDALRRDVAKQQSSTLRAGT